MCNGEGWERVAIGSIGARDHRLRRAQVKEEAGVALLG